MAAPTEVRAESVSMDTATLRWAYSGVNVIRVYRSTDGVSYAEATTTVTRVAVTTLIYIDVGLEPGTKYWYKLTDDEGGTYSSVVTVWTHACIGPADPVGGFSLPRFAGMDASTDEASAQLDDMEARIEAVIGSRIIEPDTCVACPEDGALVFDCSNGCTDWVVIADEDINSVTIDWCDAGEVDVELVIPGNVTRRICGFPAGLGFSGDECTKAPIVTGANGASINLSLRNGAVNPGGTRSRPTTGKPVAAGGGGGSGGCACVPTGLGELTIKSCNDGNSIKCASTKSLRLIACGGVAPYTWSNTGDTVLSKDAGPTTTVTPPTNSGSGTAGTAFINVRSYCYCDASGVCNPCNGATNGVLYTLYGCNDNVVSNNNAVDSGDATGCGAGFAGTPTPGTCTNCGVPTCTSRCSGTQVPWPTAAAAGSAFLPVNGGVVCDKRTAPMISAGCVPCGLVSGTTVSVTDAVGTVATIIVRS